ncbi:hypothetical protein GGR54DRAFT_636555 [Hypoxylon sp. NC1633]|nr:hypothetical protein GGR54DRAFT_636555 [Hypoxylon sp. NC1633]
MEYLGAYDSLNQALKYDFISELTPGVWKITRKSDRIDFLAHDITDTLTTDPSLPIEDSETPLHSLLGPNGLDMLTPVAAILSHENLVSLVDWFSVEKSVRGGRFQRRHYSVWDFCDAGNLGNLLNKEVNTPPNTERYPDDDELVLKREEEDNVRQGLNPDGSEPPPITSGGHLPESLCWHVLVSVLKALAWLHDGSRNVSRDKQHGLYMDPDPDWEPMLHRNIIPNNIFLSHPRRDEWYGACKLGNYGNLFVSNHHHGASKNPKTERKLSKALAPPRMTKFQPLRDLVVLDEKYSYSYPQENDQPYTIMSEWRELGLIMQGMMIHPVSDDHLKRVSLWDVATNLKYVPYSADLKNIVVMLMTVNPDEKTKEGSYVVEMRDTMTSSLCLQAINGFEAWKKSKHPEARKMVHADDLFVEQLVEDRREERAAAQSSEEVKQVLLQQDTNFGDVPLEPVPPELDFPHNLEGMDDDDHHHGLRGPIADPMDDPIDDLMGDPMDDDDDLGEDGGDGEN